VDDISHIHQYIFLLIILFFLPMIFCKIGFSVLAIHEETSLKSSQKSVIERQLFIKCLHFPSFGRQVLNTFYIMYIVKLVKHFSLFQVYTLYSCKRCNCYFYTPSTIDLYMWFAKTYIQFFQVVSLLQTIFNLLSIWFVFTNCYYIVLANNKGRSPFNGRLSDFSFLYW
jgi:hypothetical protein